MVGRRVEDDQELMMPRIAFVVLTMSAAACASDASTARGSDDQGIDSLNARIAEAYRVRDPQLYSAQFTDSAVFEWPAFNTVRGRAGLEGMVRSNWAALTEQALRLNVASRRFADDHATEFGAFEQTFRDSSGARNTEFGRYVAVLVRRDDGRWLMDHFLGFSDSTRAVR
jgi:ketosteroid isomerase-like protein